MKKTMKIKTQFRQGDVLIERVTSKPTTTSKPDKSRVLAHGEATGHAHTVGSGTVRDAADWWKDDDLSDAKMTRKMVTTARATKVTHQEHDPISLERGVYRVTRQREYSPEAIRNVAD